MNFILNDKHHNIHNTAHLILVINIIKMNINIPFKGPMYNAFFDVHQTFNVYLTHIRPRKLDIILFIFLYYFPIITRYSNYFLYII